MVEVEKLKRSEQTEHLWGCFLLAQCRSLINIGKVAYEKLADRLRVDIERKCWTMQEAAHYLYSTRAEMIRSSGQDDAFLCPQSAAPDGLGQSTERKGKGEAC